MKYSFAVATLLALQVQDAVAFAPSSILKVPLTQRSAIVDPSIFADVHQHVDSIASMFSSLSLADGSGLPDGAVVAGLAGVSDAAVVADGSILADGARVVSAAGAAAEITKNDNGWFGFLEAPIEFLLQGIHTSLVGVGMNANAWGLTILTMTTVIKLPTYPLTKQQLGSTQKMQTLQPTIKDIQAKYASNPEVMNQKIAEIYQTNDVNPLAGCLPSILQIPIFIGLYRAVLTLAKDNKLDEPFLWLPNLEGPTYGADPAHGSDWILKNWVDGVPTLGWADSLAFLSIPIVLVISQSVSMNMMATKDQEQPAVLKFLPLLIGWFSLNVPAALGIYWVANNFITTALSLQIRSSLANETPAVPATTGPVIDVAPSTFTPAPMSEKPAGFASTASSDDIKPITAIDAEVVGGETQYADSSIKKKRGKGKKKKKKRN